MTSILLDTNALLWLVSTPDRVAPAAQAVIADPAHELLVSAASVWEIAIKTRLGRLNGEALLAAWDNVIDSMGVSDIVIESADAAVAGAMAWDHKDPFDRMIVTQALRRGLTIATSDQAIIDHAVTPVIDTRSNNKP